MLRNLKLLRKERNLSQQRLADAVNVSQQSINQYENHNIEPDIAVLSRLADYFDTSIDFIVGRTDVRRRIEPTQLHHLSEEEVQIIERYRSLKEKQRRCVSLVINTLLEK